VKLPALNLSSLSELALRHGEKVVVAIVALVGLWLAWGGIDAMRSLSVTQAQTPQAVEQAASQARAHIDRDAQPPADLLSARTPLADLIDPWRTPLVPWKSGSTPWLAIAAPPALALLDNPLFEEAAKRGKPEVLPIEDLRAVAGLAILPPVVAKDGQPAQQPAAQPARPKPAETPRGRRPPKGADPLAGGGELAPAPEAMAGEGPPQPEGRVVPYVIVTGLIPVAKQQAEYRSRFEACGFRDPKRDSPLWCDFEIERSSVGANGKEAWTKIDLAAVAKNVLADRGDGAVGGDLASFQLGAGEDARSRQTTPLPFCSGLPPRIDDTWELGDLHPWVVERLVERLAKVAAGQETVPQEAANPLPGREGPDFGGPEERPPDPIMAEAKADLPAYRMFRFIDTDVEPGGTYRYRVRLKVWNPNYDRNPERMRPHLTDPSLALETKLASAEGKPSPAASVPETTRVVVAPLSRSEIKDLKLKQGTYEILVLAPRDPTRELDPFALRGLVGDPGVEINVDEKLNLKNQKDRARGLAIKTERMLVDARGRQEDRREGPAEKEKPPGVIPEPLDLLVMRKDGTFDLVTTADSERPVSAYIGTLPRRGAKADVVDPTAAGGISGELPVDPLSRPGAGK